MLQHGSVVFLTLTTYQILCTTIYLFMVSFIQTLDITLVLYLVFAILPFITHFKINGKIELIFLSYFLGLLLISIFKNGLSDSISVFVIRYIGIIFGIYFFMNKKNSEMDNSKLFKEILVAMGCETMIGILGILISGGGRLMLNYQCTVGNISIASILLVAIYMKNTRKNIWLSICFLVYINFWTIFSGTRAYLIITVILSLILVFLYSNNVLRTLILCLLITTIIMFLSSDTLMSLVLKTTRLDESTGRRSSENLFVLKYMSNFDIRTIFGYGFGTVVGNLPGASNVIAEVSNSEYTNYIINQVSGFHNFFFTVYYSSGLVGLALTVILFLKLIYVFLKSPISKSSKLYLIAYIFLYLLLLWYRWSCTSGILEFALLSYVFNLSKKNELNYFAEERMNVCEQTISC